MTAPFIPEGMNIPGMGVPDNADPVDFSKPQGLMSVPEMAGVGADVVRNVMRVESNPIVAGLAGMFIPGFALVQPWIVMLAPSLEQALDATSKSNGGDFGRAIMELMAHLTKGMPNSPALSGGSVAPTQTDMTQDPSAIPSAQGQSAQGGPIMS